MEICENSTLVPEVSGFIAAVANVTATSKDRPVATLPIRARTEVMVFPSRL